MPNPFTLLENHDAAKYLPELTVSMAIKFVSANSSKNIPNSDDWKHINRFESNVYEGIS